MNSYEEFFRLPGWQEILRQFKIELLQNQRPPDQIILDDADLCKMLKICKRTASDLRKNGQIVYHKCVKKILYKLSDVLDYLEKNRVEPPSKQIKSRFK